MLRFLFNEPRRQDPKEIVAFNEAVSTFLKALGNRRTRVPVEHEKLVQVKLWCRGFVDALNELEQSLYCAERYGQLVRKPYLESMSQEELDDYRRFVYFYKNALIRLFSILDKLGYFLDELLHLQTGRIKPKFSFFTVLRGMRQRHAHTFLEEQLSELKADNRVTLDKLREQRNMEIHFINAEMLDDLSAASQHGGDRLKVEDVRANIEELKKGYDMVSLSLQIAFTYLSRGH